ncbi:GntR family transcriptional regulator [Paraburkholderia fungorum]|uniref:GntR family transcriptional regulator n=1 Tax=Paraburkholderia fungorum TaxID=134537 RepID=UPI001C1EAA82|nr:GntR family transcriptional regulator [Paraburkholderia fungorum]MBU7443498.1 GntR family transcriptional regulator [Paraburkholderia fungorum]
MVNTASLSAVSIGNSLADILRDRIATGVYKPGEWIRESAIANEFGYSNGPIREALQLLVSEELLVREPRRGMRVTELSVPEIIEIFQVRGALLELAAELAASRIVPQTLSQAEKLLQSLDGWVAHSNTEKLMKVGHALSMWLCEASGSARLSREFARLTLQSRMYTYTSLSKRKDRSEIAKPWHELIAALKQKDATAARRATRHMTQRTLDGLGLSAGI